MAAARKGPNTDAISSTTEKITHTADLLKSRIFRQYIPYLDHRCSPTESLIQVIEYFDGIGPSPFLEESADFLSQTFCSTQAIASRLRLCMWFQTVVLPKGFQLPFS